MEVEIYEVWYLWDQENCSYSRSVCIKVERIQEKVPDVKASLF